jgi:DNA-binding ferritin-like protein
MPARAPELRETPPPRLVPGEVEPNALGLSEEHCREMVEALNRDIATLLVLFHQSKKHYWVAQGPEARGLRALLDEHARTLLEDADALAARTSALGGVPPAAPAALEALASVPPEPEGLFSLRVMLGHDLRAQEQLVRELRRHVTAAETAKDYGTSFALRGVLARQEQLAHRLQRTLAEESLAVGVARRRFGLRDAPARREEKQPS